MRECCVELMKAYKKAYANPQVESHKAAVREAVASPAPRHWLSPQEAARQISLIEKGLPPEYQKGTMRYEALISLYEQYKRLRRRRFPTESIAFVTAFACLEPAKRFFISERSARRIIEKIKSGVYVL